MNQEIVIAAQDGLRKAGYPCGVADGAVGPLTRNAAYYWYKERFSSSTARFEYSRAIYLAAQTFLRAGGYYTGEIDGVNGPKTMGAAVDYRNRSNTKLVGTSAGSLRMIAAAKAEVAGKIRETSKNQGPGIEKYWRATSYGVAGYANREPWCCAFICWIVMIAFPGVSWRPRSASCYKSGEGSLEGWAKENAGKMVMYKVPLSMIQAGDIIIFGFSHVCLCVGRTASGELLTIEGNTDDGGSREGNGVYQRVRGSGAIRSAHRILV